MDPFWLVWSPTGFPPKFRHPNMVAAKEEAARLANANPGKDFFVLESLGHFSTEPVVKAVFHPVIDIPF